MKNFVVNLRRIIGDETDDGFYTPIPDGIAPNFLQKRQKEVFPKSVLKPWISYLPISKGMKNDETRFTTHEGRIQIDCYAKDPIQVIDLVEAINQRFVDFFEVKIHEFKDPYEWEETEDNSGIYVNPNYDDQRRIILFGNYDKVTTMEAVLATPESWLLATDGLYVNGDYNQLMTLVIDGKTFPEGDTAIERGFIGINDKTPLRELDAEEFETDTFTLEYDVFYNSYRPVMVDGTIDTIFTSGNASEE